MTEKFAVAHPPSPEDPSDYDIQGRVRLPSEYADWLASGDNWLAGRASVANDNAQRVAGPVRVNADHHDDLTVISPLPGTTYVLDPDLPPSSRLLDLRARGCNEPRWTCDTLDCRLVGGQSVAELREGHHVLRVLDPVSGSSRETWIVVKPL